MNMCIPNYRSNYDISIFNVPIRDCDKDTFLSLKYESSITLLNKVER